MKQPILIVKSLIISMYALGAFVAYGQTPSKYIVVDQFGYPTEAKKIAVIRNPEVGFDANESFTPGTVYSLVNQEGEKVYTAAPVTWSSGALDAVSGDRAWWFDFSTVTIPGNYYILDEQKNVRSFEFTISNGVYNDILKHAMRTFFYQRAGFAKQKPYAEEGWADGASHMQDKQARVYNDRNNASTNRDLHGGWYDAGDYNKYSNWTADYIIQMMMAYIEKPTAWTDNYNIPESGNGIPDLLDEAKWGIDFLLRMQESNGSVLSIVSLGHASPPSQATDPSYYGTASTSASLNAAAAFAIASRVYKEIGMNAFAEELVEAAENAWDWAVANPDVTFYNNSASHGTQGVGAGQQEITGYRLDMAKLKASCFLFEATGKSSYRSYFDSNYRTSHLFEWVYAYTYETDIQDMILYYVQIPGATTSVVNAIRSTYKTAMDKDYNFTRYTGKSDPYRSFVDSYTWGSNGNKAGKGSMFYNVISYDINESKEVEAYDAALGYINYLHGVNPLNLVYLSNMYAYGAKNSVNEFYHTWFSDRSPKWDRVGVSTYGPAPGFLTGGPNPGYNWDGVCPGFGTACTSESISPPKGQPALKSYKDFNTNWPLNSWEVTENSNGYQMRYIRLLSKFVDTSLNCELIPEDPACIKLSVDNRNTADIVIYPNPVNGMAYVQNLPKGNYTCTVYSNTGVLIKTLSLNGNQAQLDMTGLATGSYVVRITNGETVFVKLMNVL